MLDENKKAELRQSAIKLLSEEKLSEEEINSQADMLVHLLNDLLTFKAFKEKDKVKYDKHGEITKEQFFQIKGINYSAFLMAFAWAYDAWKENDEHKKQVEGLKGNDTTAKQKYCHECGAKLLDK